MGFRSECDHCGHETVKRVKKCAECKHEQHEGTLCCSQGCFCDDRPWEEHYPLGDFCDTIDEFLAEVEKLKDAGATHVKLDAGYNNTSFYFVRTK